MVDFTSVGVSTEVIVRGLILYQQHTYYATIRGTHVHVWVTGILYTDASE